MNAKVGTTQISFGSWLLTLLDLKSLFRNLMIAFSIVSFIGALSSIVSKIVCNHRQVHLRLPEHFEDWTPKSQTHLSTLNSLQVKDKEFESQTSSGKILVIQSPEGGTNYLLPAMEVN